MGLRDAVIRWLGGSATKVATTAVTTGEVRSNAFLAWIEAVQLGNMGGRTIVTEETALTYSALFAAVRALAEGVAMLPLKVYRKRPDGGKEEAEDHPLYELLHLVPNDEMPSYQWRETAMIHLGTWGNHYSEITYDQRGRVTELYPLDPSGMEVKRENGRLVYVLDRKTTYPAERILHIPGLAFDGLVGYSPVALARRSIGYGISLDVEGKQFIDNGSSPGGVLEHPGVLKDEAHKRLIASWEARHQGAANAGKVAILEEGMKYVVTGVPPKDAQFLEQRKFNISEIARWYKVPLHMLADLDRATFSNIEEMSLEFVVYSLQPWLTRWEQWMSIKLLTRRERMQGFFIQFKIDGLLRGDIKSRYEAYAVGRQNGWLSANDIRGLENMNPVEGGDVYLVPLNMVDAKNIGEVPATAGGELPTPAEQNALSVPLPEGRGRAGEDATTKVVTTGSMMEVRARSAAGMRNRLAGRQQRVFRDIAERILRRERADVKRRAAELVGKAPLNVFEQWLESFYEGHAAWSAQQMLPAMLAYAGLVSDQVALELDQDGDLAEQVENFTQAYALEFGSREAARNLASLLGLVRQVLTPDALLEEIEGRLDEWVETKPEAIGHEESVRENNAVAVALYGVLGVRKLTSVATGESSCPYCRALDGKTIGIDEYFLEPGEFKPEGAEAPLTVSAQKRHSPFHGGCDCVVVAG